MKDSLWRFTDNLGSFESKAAAGIKSLYFPLANERLMSSVSPDLHGDIKSGQNSFLMPPVSRIDLVTSRASRNFWLYINEDKIWSAAGVSKDLKQIQNDKFSLEAGLLWHKVTRRNQEIGLQSEILSFIPATPEPIEIMQVKITNISSKAIEFIPTAAIPIYARSANSLRDHRHVTSLLQRVSLDKFGIIVKPTLLFDETGHYPNKDIYFVLGWDRKFNPPQYLYPTQEIFCGDAGDLEAPESILKNALPAKGQIQGKETMGALRFHKVNLAPGKSYSYTVLMGITKSPSEIKKIIHKFDNIDKVSASLEKTKDFWASRSQQTNLATGDPDFDNWFRWVSIQPHLRRIFGCSFLPDFDYGKGGRGWRDLWQDCLGLILNNPGEVRKSLINNFSGVRIDGSNATIIGKNPGEFIADRNNIARVWMDHGVWPLLSLDLYINETGDFDILFEDSGYFRDQHILRSREHDKAWKQSDGNKLKSVAGKIYRGTILEHLLVQNLVQFFNVGSHNHVRLEGADWNDGLDMAAESGESVAFSAMYAYNLKLLSGLIKKAGRNKITLAQELRILLRKSNYNNIKEKQKILAEYFSRTSSFVSGKKISIGLNELADILEERSEWIAGHIRKSEWLKNGFFNGYYDNKKRRVEGIKNNKVRMMLESQVFPVMAEVADNKQIASILGSAKKYLQDKNSKSLRLNTDFKEEQHDLGRAFSFIYGDKENGAYFSHMNVMFSYALYKRGYAKEGWQVLNSIYNMAMNTQMSKIYPCLPEYFDLEGRGMYSYLTGSASWFVLTLLAQVFGVRGQDGDLLIEPKLCAEQFKKTATITLRRTFAGRNLEIVFVNPKKLGYPGYKIVKAALNSFGLALINPHLVVIPRKIIKRLSSEKANNLRIILG
ncbi:MAG: cellobiose phosphorylase [Candidatus Omnitrophica bacterium]|nr:cellobiose phosphorylase [Candidatus Omnitrophota bacterium]